MTFFKSSSSLESDSLCRSCATPLVWRQAYPYPVITQLLFGFSFVVFLFVFEWIREALFWITLWCMVQVGLGLLLIQRRLRAKKRILICIRCQ